jgi:hypothetical protein
MRRGKRRPPLLYGVVHLPQQVFEVLSGKPREAALIKPLCTLAMAGCASTGIELRAMRNIFAITGRRNQSRRQSADIRSQVSDILNRAHLLAVADVLHAWIPALVMAIVDQLSRYDAKMLGRNRRSETVGAAGTIRPVAGRTPGVERVATYNIRRALQGCTEIL